MAGTKDRFLDASAELFRVQGYSGTGLKEIAARAEAPWGSMYHFFPGGKEQLASEAVLAAGEKYRAAFARLFEAIPDPIEAMARVFRNEAAVLEASDFRDGCPIASTALDVASTVDGVRSACAQVFVDWSNEIAKALLRAGVARPEAADIANFVLSTLEGAIILARTSRSAAPLRAAEKGTALALASALKR